MTEKVEGSMARPRKDETTAEPFVYVNSRTGVPQLRKSALRLLAEVSNRRLLLKSDGPVLTVRVPEDPMGDVVVRWDVTRGRLFVGEEEFLDHNAALIRAEHLASENASVLAATAKSGPVPVDALGF